jgi:hypothetical protein
VNEGVSAEIRHLASLNIDELPENPEDVEKLLEKKPEPKEEPKPEAKPEGKPEDKPKEEAKPEGDIIAKDGKNLIPHSVLEATREREAEARRLAQEALDRARAAEEELARLKAGGKPEPEKGKESKAFFDELDQSITALDGEDGAPALAATLRGLKNLLVQQQGQIEDQAKVISRHDADLRAGQEQADREVGQTVTEAIDAIPALAYLRDAADKDEKVFAMWNRVAKFDLTARGGYVGPDGREVFVQANKDPEYLKLSFAERFTKALAATEAAYGKVEVPASYQSKVAEKPKVEPKQQSPEEIEKRAKEELEKAAKKPLTLSDLPGGVLPATTERLDTSNMSVSEIERMFDGKDQAGIDRLLSRSRM